VHADAELVAATANGVAAAATRAPAAKTVTSRVNLGTTNLLNPRKEDNGRDPRQPPENYPQRRTRVRGIGEHHQDLPSGHHDGGKVCDTDAIGTIILNGAGLLANSRNGLPDAC
jgi:hypothetical protein